MTPQARRTFSFCLFIAAQVLSSAAWAERVQNPIAVFNGLDKITGITTSFEVKIKEEATFGGLKIKPFVCYTRPVTQAPKTTSFVQVEEIPLGGQTGTSGTQAKRIFSGWMFAESPSINAVEHPIFDVWLVGCLDPNAPPPPVEVPLADRKAADENAASESGDTGTETDEDTTKQQPSPSAAQDAPPEAPEEPSQSDSEKSSTEPKPVPEPDPESDAVQQPEN